jgi:hypothetical protein
MIQEIQSVSEEEDGFSQGETEARGQIRNPLPSF